MPDENGIGGGGGDPVKTLTFKKKLNVHDHPEYHCSHLPDLRYGIFQLTKSSTTSYFIPRPSAYATSITAFYLRPDPCRLHASRIQYVHAVFFWQDHGGSLYGRARTSALYLPALIRWSVIVANIPTYIKKRDDYSYRSLGASGVSAPYYSPLCC